MWLFGIFPLAIHSGGLGGYSCRLAVTFLKSENNRLDLFLDFLSSGIRTYMLMCDFPWSLVALYGLISILQQIVVVGEMSTHVRGWRWFNVSSSISLLQLT